MPVPLIAPAVGTAARYATVGLLEALLPYVPRAVTQRILPTTLTKTPKQAREFLLKTDSTDKQLDNLIYLDNNTTDNNATQSNNNSLFTSLQEIANNNLHLNNNLYLWGK